MVAAGTSGKSFVHDLCIRVGDLKYFRIAPGCCLNLLRRLHGAHGRCPRRAWKGLPCKGPAQLWVG
eukprot:1732630-Alexandrium_andersonii.AAC.1